MKEASKAMRRRYIEDALSQFQWMKLFRGDGIDIGCGDDRIPFARCAAFDKEQGDANDLTKYFPPNHFSYLHSSQSLEHMVDPEKALRSWIAVVKPRGYIIVTVPSWELYEGMVWPSRFNPNHKSTWSLWQKDSPAPTHIYVPEWLQKFKDVAKIVRCDLADNKYDYHIGTTRDQTLDEATGTEAFIEFVLQKK